MTIKILITGGSGFVGRNLINFLENTSRFIINYCDNEIYSIPFKPINKTTIKLRIDISDITESDLSDFDILVHLAAVKKHNVEEGDFDELVRTNIVETNNLFRRACSAGVKKIIFSSSLYAHGNLRMYNANENDLPIPNTLYGNSKLFGENVLRELSLQYPDIKFVVFRLYFIYGPHQYYGKGYPSVFLNTLTRLKMNKAAIIKNDGKQELDYLYVDDLCYLINQAIDIDLENNFEILNASSGNAYSIEKIIHLIMHKDNKNSVIYDGTDFTKGTYRSGDNSKTKKLLNWYPKKTLEQGVDKLIDWFHESSL